MGLFSRFKSNTFESMDELEQMDLADGLGITDIKRDIRSIKAQLTDLENSSNWKANIITAIDPDKKYILPMDETGDIGNFRTYAWIEEGFWQTARALHDGQAISFNYCVAGKDILSAPDWVKAIKPIEVEE